MGLIKKIFGAIFSFLGGIFKIFGLGGQKSEFFMEIEDAAAPVLEAIQTNEAPPAKPTPAQAETAAPAEKAAKKSVKEKPAQEQAQSTLKEALAPVPAPVEAAMPKIKNFATDYLVNPKVNRSPRRRPGPSVGPFKEMAREVRKSGAMG